MARAFRETQFGDLLIGYTNLFKPPRQVIRMTRLARLIEDLLDMISAGKVERGGRIFSAPQTYWQQALEEMLARRDSLTLPIKSHGYLITIIAGYSDKAEAKAEAKAEERKRHGSHHLANAGKIIKSGSPVSLRDTLKQFNKGGSDGDQA